MSRRTPKLDEALKDMAAEAIAEAEEAKTQEAIEMAVGTLTGDLRTAFLDRLRYEQNKRPWHERSEAEQRETVHAIDSLMRSTVTTAVELIAGHGRRAIKATIDSVLVKDGYKAVLTCSRHDENRHHLADAQGSTVLIVIADAEVFTGERAPVEIRPDQATLLDSQVVHSQAEDNHDSPLD